MAEAVFAGYLVSRGLQARILSRGLAAPAGARPHRFAMQTAQTHGMPIDPAKRATPVTLPELQAATIILVMDRGHRHAILQNYPVASGKTFLLGHWLSQSPAGQDIVDPLHQPLFAFEAAWQRIEAGVQTWLSHLNTAGLMPEAVSGPSNPTPAVFDDRSNA